MTQPYQVLKIGRVVLLVLAYVVAVVNVVAGVMLLFTGGGPIPLGEGGPELPARLFGVIGILVSAPLSFVLLYVPSGLIALLLELRAKG